MKRETESEIIAEQYQQLKTLKPRKYRLCQKRWDSETHRITMTNVGKSQYISWYDKLYYMHRNRGETRKGKLGRSCTKWMDTSREGIIPYCGINKRKPTEPSLTVNCTSQ